MSAFTRYYRQQWIQVVYADAVDLFHEARKTSRAPLADLARACANTAFSAKSDVIVGDKEVLARQFMKHCREHFGTEINRAIAEKAQKDIENAQVQEAQAS